MMTAWIQDTSHTNSQVVFIEAASTTVQQFSSGSTGYIYYACGNITPIYEHDLMNFYHYA